MKREIVRIYRSSRQNETYLYMAKKVAFETLPEELQKLFGKPILVLDMLLTPDKKLARVDASKVLNGLEEKGFYLQLPPPKEDYLLDLYREKSQSDHG
jgi:uncharacterized protein YcgL (UPF0745 family)